MPEHSQKRVVLPKIQPNMPTFDFQCSACNHVFEFNRPFGSNETCPCPECGNGRVEKLIATPTIAFKGEGFYKTDSQKKSEIQQPEKKAEKKEEEKNNDTPAEKTPEPKKEQKDSKKEEK